MSAALFLLVIPQNRFCEQQLFDLKEVLEGGGRRMSNFIKIGQRSQR